MPLRLWEEVQGLLHAVTLRTIDEGRQPQTIAQIGQRTAQSPSKKVVPLTFGSRLNFNPHVHAVVSRGGWSSGGRFIPVSYLDTHAAELLFRHKVLRLLKHEGLIDDHRIDVMLSWHHTGFSIHNQVSVHREDRPALERLCRYFLRSPVSLARLRWDERTDQVAYALKDAGAHDEGEEDAVAEEVLDARDFLARVITHIAEPKLHLIHYFGAYSHVLRARRPVSSDAASPAGQEPIPPSTRRRLWANLVRRIYETDPLRCPRCQGQMRIIAFITDPKVVRKILQHVATHRTDGRAPPHELAAIPVAP